MNEKFPPAEKLPCMYNVILVFTGNAILPREKHSEVRESHAVRKSACLALARSMDTMSWKRMMRIMNASEERLRNWTALLFLHFPCSEETARWLVKWKTFHSIAQIFMRNNYVPHVLSAKFGYQYYVSLFFYPTKRNINIYKFISNAKGSSHKMSRIPVRQHESG